MDDRLKKLLAIVVEEVVKTGEPVGSQHLVESFGLDVSPATIRNWFAELEDSGYVSQTHTSSGRVPTEKGYQCYLNDLMERKALPKRMRTGLESAVAEEDDSERRLKSIAKYMAETAQNAVLLGLGDADTFYTGLSKLFSQPEFRDWNRMVSLGQVLDRMDEVLARVREKRYDAPTALIGRDCPFGNACGSIALTLSDGTLVGILGPIRMDYRLGFALLETTKEILETL